MNAENMLFLKRMAVERVKLLAQARNTVALAQSAEGGRAQFTTQLGVDKSAVVLRMNKKTASLRIDDGERWTVWPALLR